MKPAVAFQFPTETHRTRDFRVVLVPNIANYTEFLGVRKKCQTMHHFNLENLIWNEEFIVNREDMRSSWFQFERKIFDMLRISFKQTFSRWKINAVKYTILAFHEPCGRIPYIGNRKDTVNLLPIANGGVVKSFMKSDQRDTANSQFWSMGSVKLIPSELERFSYETGMLGCGTPESEGKPGNKNCSDRSQERAISINSRTLTEDEGNRVLLAAVMFVIAIGGLVLICTLLVRRS